MVIGVDASRANKTQKTGVEWYSYHLIQGFKKIPLKPGDKFILYSQSKLKGELAHLPDNWQNKVLSWPFKYIWTQIRLCWEVFINPPDVLFVSAHCLPIFCRAKSAITIHDLGFKRFPQVYSFWQRIYARFVHWWAVKKANQIIVPSEFTKKELIEMYQTKEDKIATIFEGYDKKTFCLIKDQKKISSVLKKYQIKESFFLYIGRLEKKKNIKGLIQAYDKLCALRSKPPKLVLIGKPGYGYSEIKDQINKNKNIITPGYVKFNDLPYFYNKATAFIFPSFYEGFGLPILEAMACGCPVLASNAGSIQEIGGQAVLYFNPNKPEELTNILKKILIDRDLKHKLIQKGLERIKGFSWEKCAQETIVELLTL